MYVTGWMFLGFSCEFPKGKIISRKFMGEDVILYRKTSGELAMLHAYCSHLGVHLGDGRLYADCIQCPMHGRLFDSNGLCTSRKYRSIRSYPVHQEGELVFGYFGETGESPRWAPPKFFSGERAGWRLFWHHGDEYTTSHPSQLLENSVDARHFYFTHRLYGHRAAESLFTAEGHRARAVMEVRFGSVLDKLKPGGTVVLDTYFDGPLVGELRYDSIWTGLPGAIAHFTTLIDSSRSRFTLVRVGPVPNGWKRKGLTVLDDLFAYGVSFAAMREDRPLWNRRRYVAHPDLYPDEDVVRKYREWFASFVRNADPQPATPANG